MTLRRRGGGDLLVRPLHFLYEARLWSVEHHILMSTILVPASTNIWVARGNESLLVQKTKTRRNLLVFTSCALSCSLPRHAQGTLVYFHFSLFNTGVLEYRI